QERDWIEPIRLAKRLEQRHHLEIQIRSLPHLTLQIPFDHLTHEIADDMRATAYDAYGALGQRLQDHSVIAAIQNEIIRGDSCEISHLGRIDAGFFFDAFNVRNFGETSERRRLKV